MSQRGILLVNTGTPEAPTIEAIRPYLERFLSDPRIVDMPQWLWQPIRRGLVLRTRPNRTVSAYQHIWTPEGSPYMLYCSSLERKLKTRLFNQCAAQDAAMEPPLVRLAHRYAAPSAPYSMRSALRLLKSHEVTDLTVLPMYPQQAFATTGSVNDELARLLKAMGYQPNIRFINSYHDNRLYIHALAGSIERAFEAAAGENGEGAQPHLVLSYHSTPIKDRRAGDPYYAQTQQTSAMIAEALGLEQDAWSIAYQSRFQDNQRWIGPFLPEHLSRLLAQGLRQVAVICPVFAIDNLETLYEVDFTARKDFLAQAGHGRSGAPQPSFTYIPALNDSEAQVELYASLVG